MYCKTLCNSEEKLSAIQQLNRLSQTNSPIQETCFTGLQTSYYFSTNKNKPIKTAIILHKFHIYKNSQCIWPESSIKQLQD